MMGMHGVCLRQSVPGIHMKGARGSHRDGRNTVWQPVPLQQARAAHSAHGAALLACHTMPKGCSRRAGTGGGELMLYLRACDPRSVLGYGTMTQDQTQRAWLGALQC